MKTTRFCDDHTIAEINQAHNRNSLCARIAGEIFSAQEGVPLERWQIENVIRSVWERGFDEGVEAEGNA